MKNLNEMTDEELALSYINGNNRAFDLLLSHNQSKLFSYILFVVRNRDVADDIFQETFVSLQAQWKIFCLDNAYSPQHYNGLVSCPEIW